MYHYASIVAASQKKWVVGQVKRKRPYHTEGQLTPSGFNTLPGLDPLALSSHFFMKTVLEMKTRAMESKLNPEKNAAI